MEIEGEEFSMAGEKEATAAGDRTGMTRRCSELRGVLTEDDSAPFTCSQLGDVTGMTVPRPLELPARGVSAQCGEMTEELLAKAEAEGMAGMAVAEGGLTQGAWGTAGPPATEARPESGLGSAAPAATETLPEAGRGRAEHAAKETLPKAGLGSAEPSATETLPEAGLGRAEPAPTETLPEAEAGLGRAEHAPRETLPEAGLPRASAGLWGASGPPTERMGIFLRRFAPGTCSCS